MLPSTGYFKGIMCPFFESGLCERPYCHFRHVKRDTDVNSDPIDNADILKQLVSEAVKKVLLQSEGSSSDIETKSQSIISQVVQELKPTNNVISDKPPMKATYNPTPIAELKKMTPAIVDNEMKTLSRDNRKHIPVPYTPHRPSRTQLSRAPVKLDSGAALSLTVQEACTTNPMEVSQDKYTPSAIESESSVKYTPGSAGDNPMPYSPIGQTGVAKGGVSYIPSNLSAGNDAVKVCGYSPVGQSTSGASYKPGVVQTSSSNSYCPANNSTWNQTDKKSFSYAPKFNYKPTPLNKAPSPTFSSDEDEEPSAKKAKLSETEELDDLDVEFEMLGEILEDENNSIKKTVDSSANNLSKTISSNDKAAKADSKQSEQENKVNKDSFDTLLASSGDVPATAQAEKSSTKYSEKTTSRKDQTKSSSTNSSNKLTSKHSSKHSRESKSSKMDHKHSTKKKEEDFTKERDKDSSSKDKDSSKDLCKKSSVESDKKVSHDHKKSDKTKVSSSHRDSKTKESTHKSTDRDSKPKTSAHHDNKSKSSSSDSKRSDSKSKSSEKPDKSHTKSSSNKHESKSVSSSKDKHKDKSHKSSHSSSSRHSSKDKSVSKESSTSKRTSSHSKDKTESKDSHSKSKVKEVDLFSVSQSDSLDRTSDADSVGSDVIEILSESDEETITQECMKIFEEYVPTTKENPSTETSKPITDEDAKQLLGKKRVAHNTNVTIYRTPPTVLPNHKTKAIQMVTDRYARVKQFHNERLSLTSTSSECSQSPSLVHEEPSVSCMPSSSKVRIAHVPYASTLINAKKTLKVPEPPKSTPVQTITKGTNRVAHMPNDKFSDRPTPLEPLASKVPINIRSKYLNMMIDDCLKIYLTAEDAYQRALAEELATNKKCTTMPIYKNSAMLTISRLRKEIKEAGGSKISNGGKSISHNKVMLGKKGETVSWSIENKYRKDHSNIANELKGNKFYQNVQQWVLSEQELRDNGFPRPHPEKKEKGCAKIYTQDTRQKPPRGLTRCCNRCRKEYVVDKKGFAVRKEECIYHPKNKYRFRGEVKYQCCSQDASSDGCLSASCHVFEYVDYDNLRGYVTTLPKEKESLNTSVYALDCEMSYTTNGLDLTRVTVINSSLNVVYETLVKPLYPIIDYNTNFSGITEEQMKGVTTTLLEVQATLLHMFSDKTILVGHSLESDFKALKLIHSTIIDTSVLFPHKMGPPYKRALRNLSSEYLKKIIQNSVDGHDSAEDAMVCMELLIWKVKEEFKTK